MSGNWGLWALDVPEELGGVNLPAVALMAVNEELWRTIVPFTFPPDSPNLHMLMAVATPGAPGKAGVFQPVKVRSG